MHGGVEYEGEETPTEPPDATTLRQAIAAWNLLSTQQGSIDWAGIPFVCELLGVLDVERLLRNLLTIKQHTPPKT